MKLSDISFCELLEATTLPSSDCKNNGALFCTFCTFNGFYARHKKEEECGNTNTEIQEHKSLYQKIVASNSK